MITDAQYAKQPKVARDIIDTQQQLDAIMGKGVLTLVEAKEVRRLVSLRRGYVDDAARIWGVKGNNDHNLKKTSSEDEDERLG